jgi:trypsin-like peptidase
MGNRKLAVCLVGLGLLANARNLCAEPKVLSPRTLNALMEQGKQALLARDYKAARDDFSDILSADPRNQMASEGATFAYLELDDFIHARDSVEKVILLSSHLSRSSAMNGAAIYLHFKTSMRSARLLMQYMKPMTDVDEQALNALATSLAQADDASRKNRSFADGVAFYIAEAKKLEATRPGMKRWGTEWLPADEADKKTAAWNAALAKQSKLGNEIAALKDKINAANAAAAGGEDGPALNGFMRSRYRANPQINTQQLQTQIDAKQAEMDKALEGVERPPIPTRIIPVDIIADNPSQGADASGSQTGANTQTPTPPDSLATTVSPSDPQASGAPPATPAPTPDATGAAPASADPAPAPKKTYRVTTYAAAFPVSANLLVTTAEAVTDATDIQVQNADGAAFSAMLVRSDPQSGLALVRIVNSKLAYMSLAEQFSGGTLSCVGFPNVDLFQPAAALINGSAISPRASWKVRLSATPRLGGGPLLSNGKVVGVELATRDSDISAIPSVTLDELKKFLGADASSGGAAGDAVAATFQLSAVRVRSH